MLAYTSLLMDTRQATPDGEHSCMHCDAATGSYNPGSSESLVSTSHWFGPRVSLVFMPLVFVLEENGLS